MPTKHTLSQRKYDELHRRTYGFRLHNEIDADIIEKLSSVPSMQGYIKQLIRDDIARTGSVPVSVPKTEKKEGKTMKNYHIKPDYLDLWEGGDTPSDPDRIITEDDIVSFAEEWGKTPEELKEQLIPID